MPVIDGGAASGSMDTPNSKKKQEIQDNIIGKIEDISNLMRNKNSIYESNNFHLDSRPLNENTYKVEIQFKAGSKKTVSVITVAATATNADDARTGLTNSLGDHHVWNVT